MSAEKVISEAEQNITLIKITKTNIFCSFRTMHPVELCTIRPGRCTKKVTYILISC